MDEKDWPKPDVEKIIRVYYKNLFNAIDGFTHNVEIDGLKALRKVLLEAVEKIDKVLEVFDAK